MNNSDHMSLKLQNSGGSLTALTQLLSDSCSLLLIT